MTCTRALATTWLRHTLLTILLGMLVIAPSSGMDARQPVEVYLRLVASAQVNGSEPVDLCASFLASLALDTTPKCRVVHMRQGILMLRWPLALPTQVETQMQMLKRQGLLHWFEIKQEYLELQAINRGDAAVAADPAYRSGIVPLVPEVGDPWFVSDDLRRLRAWNSMMEVQGQIVIAVIDSGINFQDPVLAAIRWHNDGEQSANGVDDDTNGYVDDAAGWDFVNEGYAQLFDDTTAPDNDPSDMLGHGTVVAQVIRAVVGSDLAERIRLMPLRVAYGLNASGAVNPAALAEAIYYAADNGAQIINISLGGAQSYEIVASAIQYALGQDVAVVAAAGNSGGAPLFPASEPGVLSVGALDRNDAVLATSARGVGVDLYASGVDMFSFTGSASLTFQASGTSFASPVVSATLALLEAAHLGISSTCQAQRLAVLNPLPMNGRLTDWIAFQLQRSERSRQPTNTRDAWQQADQNCGAPAASLSSLVRKQ